MSIEQELEIWKLVNQTKSVPELLTVLESIGPIEISGNRGTYNTADALNKVLNGYPVNMLTRNFGIRQQYSYLIERESF